MKKIALVLCAGMLVASFSGCLSNAEKTASSVASAAESAVSSEVKAAESAVDAATSASPKESSKPDDLVKGLSKDGYWIFAILSDVTVDKEIVVDGEFHDKGDATKDLYRKLALYSQDADRNVTAQFTLTVPKITVNSPNFKISHGTVKGDVFVNANGFNLEESTIEGNLSFASEDVKATAVLDKGTVTGTTSVGAAATDAVASASPKESSNPEDLVKGLSKDGFWIFSILSDVTLDKELVVDGEFHDKDDAAKPIYRKLALYAQDADHKVTANYTLTVPKITVNSPNFKIANGTVKGDVYVTADGFTLESTIDGNLTFATEAAKASAVLDKGTVKGTTSVG